jgi:hypothetical protein
MNYEAFKGIIPYFFHRLHRVFHRYVKNSFIFKNTFIIIFNTFLTLFDNKNDYPQGNLKHKRNKKAEGTTPLLYNHPTTIY